jgi:hypothetical protein
MKVVIELEDNEVELLFKAWVPYPAKEYTLKEKEEKVQNIIDNYIDEVIASSSEQVAREEMEATLKEQKQQVKDARQSKRETKAKK